MATAPKVKFGKIQRVEPKLTQRQAEERAAQKGTAYKVGAAGKKKMTRAAPSPWLAFPLLPFLRGWSDAPVCTASWYWRRPVSQRWIVDCETCVER